MFDHGVVFWIVLAVCSVPVSFGIAWLLDAYVFGGGESASEAVSMLASFAAGVHV